MTKEEFYFVNTQLSPEQFEKFEVFNAPKDVDTSLYRTESNYCGLTYIGDNGRYSVMKATRRTSVIVDNIRNGKIVSSGWVHMNQGDTLNLLQNNGGLDYDGYRC
jgi:hypothetical protein